ncbi:hypothetical protein EMIT0357P_120162 [Pseudomonas marginalis]
MGPLRSPARGKPAHHKKARSLRADTFSHPMTLARQLRRASVNAFQDGPQEHRNAPHTPIPSPASRSLL